MRPAPSPGRPALPAAVIPRFVLLCAMLAAQPAWAHEFWLLPQHPQPSSTGATVPLALAVGEQFEGERVAFSRALVAGFRRHAAGASHDLLAVLPREGRSPLVQMQLRAGTHLVELTTHPAAITLSADQFHAYLHEEGLDHITRQREASGRAHTPARERYRRTVKALVQVGETTDDSHAVRTGQKLELVPAGHPARQAPGEDLAFQVLFEGRPLSGALVKFWHRRGGQTLVVRTRSDAHGRVVVTPPWPGPWMASVVHMVPVTDSSEFDWDSYWGNYTFSLGQRR